MTLLLKGAGKQTPAAGGAFSPLDLSPDFWIKADSESYADLDPVGTATDRSGNARNATQATGAQKPTFRTNIVNGYPVYRFDGTDDRLVTASFSLTDLTCVAVVKLIATGSYPMITSRGTDQGELRYFDTGSIPEFSLTGAALSWGVAAGTANFHVIAATFNDTSNATSINLDGGTAVTGSDANAWGAAATLTLGGRSTGGLHANIDLAELFVKGSVLSAGDMTSLVNHLKTKYGIA